MADPEPTKALKAIADAVTRRRPDDPALTVPERGEILLRSAVELIPFGIGGAVGELYWGTRDKRWQKKIEDTVKFLQARIALTEGEVGALREYYASDEFAALFEGVWVRIRAATQRQKLEALRGALLSILVKRPDFGQGQHEFFVSALDRMTDVHIQVLQLYRERMDRGEPGWFMPSYEVFEVIGARSESNQQLAYAALDTLANLRFIEHGNIPRRGGADGPIDYPNQRFRATTLGAEFLDFVRATDGEPPAPA